MRLRSRHGAIVSIGWVVSGGLPYFFQINGRLVLRTVWKLPIMKRRA